MGMFDSRMYVMDCSQHKEHAPFVVVQLVSTADCHALSHSIMIRGGLPAYGWVNERAQCCSRSAFLRWIQAAGAAADSLRRGCVCSPACCCSCRRCGQGLFHLWQQQRCLEKSPSPCCFQTLVVLGLSDTSRTLLNTSCTCM